MPFKLADMEWFTRSGEKFEGPKVITRNYGPVNGMLGAADIIRSFRIGGPVDVNEEKGTACYQYEDTCTRCGGAGGASQWTHTGWTCFECGGTGMGPIRTGKLYSADRLAKLNATQAKRDAASAAKAAAEAKAREDAAQAERVAFCAAHRDLMAGLEWYVEAYGAGNAPEDRFLIDLWAKLDQFGKLTEGQCAAALKAVDALKARLASNHIGVIGKRMEATLTCGKVIHFEQRGPYAAPSLYLCKDEQGNAVVYKGTACFMREGATAKVKFTVEDHGQRNGVNQTIIARPKVLGTLDPEDGKFYQWDSTVGGMVEVK